MRYLVVLCVFLFSCGTRLAAQSPADLLKEAVGNSKMCGFSAQKFNLMKSPPMPETTGTRERERVKKLSLELMFKEGRYDTGSRVTLIPNSSIAVVTFTPLAENQLPPGEGEDSELNKILNNLKGYVYIDSEWRGIVKLYSELSPESLRLNYWRLPLVNLESLELTMDQERLGNSWMPETFALTFSGEFAKRDFYRRYTADFHCSSAE